MPIIRKVMKPSCTLSTAFMLGLRPSIVSVIVVTWLELGLRVRVRGKARVRGSAPRSGRVIRVGRDRGHLDDDGAHEEEAQAEGA